MREAAIDPLVSSIKITLYRLVSKNSKIIHTLINAARNGKSVTVVVELKARFDEESNMNYADQLQDEGVRVIFGAPGLKVHTKLLSAREKKEAKIFDILILEQETFTKKLQNYIVTTLY